MLLVFLGPPGSGKGTQSAFLEERYGLKQLSTGDMLREEIANATELGKSVKSLIEGGKLVPDDIIVSMIESRIDAVTANGIILDGFPRNQSQAESLDKMLSKKKLDISSVLELQVDDNLLIDRIVNRFSCKKCGANYNKKFNPVKNPDGSCDNCGANDFYYRPDDNVETVKSRLKVYHEETSVLVSYYKSQEKLVSIDGMKSTEDVSKDIFSVLDKIS